jgi:DNA adenine methylase
MRRLTPLRYPGGKAQLGEFFAAIIERNRLSDAVYAEPFAGGAGVGIGLLLGEYVGSILINDVDAAVVAFWKSVVEQNAELCQLVRSALLTVKEWKRQRAIYARGLDSGDLALGFAMFYLNRTNRSGILNGGVIGGKNQKGAWKIDARFNRDELIARIRRIGRYRSRIHVSNEDAGVFLKRTFARRTLLYLDPPYYVKGQHLYTNFYHHADHVEIADAIRRTSHPWVVSYDDHPAIRKLYSGLKRVRYSLGYSARAVRKGAEVMFFSPGLSAPRSLRLGA